MSGRTHHRLDDTRAADPSDRGFEFLLRGGKLVSGSRQAELLGSEAAYSFTVHREEGGVGGRNDLVALLFEFDEFRSGNSLDFRYDQIRFLLFDHLCESVPVKHRKDV